MATQSEAQLEKNLIEQLTSLGYTNLRIENEEQLENNFRTQINTFNALTPNPLTDSEFKRLLLSIKGKGVIASSKALRDKIEIQRDDNTKLFVKLFDSKNSRKNIFQVTHQVTVVGNRENRYDVTILANGLPIIQIELKRRGIEIKEALNQINRYRRETFTGLYEFLQLFIISNGANTKYFANSPSSAAIPFSQVFYWTDESNTRITALEDFTSNFLPPSHVSDMLSLYMVIRETGEKGLIVMRPYQIFGAKRVVRHALETSGNGYIWHTTGSGKTLTSFKISQILAESAKFSKVLFLIDRRDLNGQTIEEFNKFESDIVADVNNTKALVKQLNDPNRKLVITTIQKLSVLVKKDAAVLKSLKNSSILFMIDECHRSQFGEMHKRIKTYFSKAQYFGFTGTPIFEENKSQDKRSTADIFGKCLHTYLIKEAIRDHNVLPFNIEYVDTFHKADQFQDYGVISINTQEILLNDARITLISQDILTQYRRKTKELKYNAMLAVESVQMLTKYFDKLTTLDPKLKTATIFSFGANEDSEGRDESSKDTLERAMKHYNKMFDTNFSLSTYSEYFADVSKRMKRREIDLLVVVNMFLTGFDSPKTNTLFFDKSAQNHSLLQAFSRTNRIETSQKIAGNIRCYRPLKEQTDKALRLFSQSDNIDTILARPYEECIVDLRQAIAELQEIATSPNEVDLLSGEAEKAEFIRRFRNLARILAEIQPHSNFNYATSKLNLTEQDIADFRSKYLDIKDESEKSESISILAEIDFELELIATDLVNVDYIRILIGNINLGDREGLEKDTKFILKQLDMASSPDLRLKSEHLKKFINEILPHLEVSTDVDVALSLFSDKERVQEITNFANQSDISYDQLKSWIEDYEYSDLIDRKDIANAISKPLKIRKNLTDAIINFIKAVTEKY